MEKATRSPPAGSTVPAGASAGRGFGAMMIPPASGSSEYQALAV
jgi:hypothetical protein